MEHDVPPWRHTFSSPRFFIFDARIMFFFLVTIMWFSKWTLTLAIVASVTVWIAEVRKRMSIMGFFRYLILGIHDHFIVLALRKKTLHGPAWRHTIGCHRLYRPFDMDADL